MKPSTLVQDAVGQLAQVLKIRPMTTNEVREWWSKTATHSQTVLRDAMKYMIDEGLVEADQLGKAKLLRLAGARPAASAVTRGIVTEEDLVAAEARPALALPAEMMTPGRTVATPPVLPSRITPAKVMDAVATAYGLPSAFIKGEPPTDASKADMDFWAGATKAKQDEVATALADGAERLAGIVEKHAAAAEAPIPFKLGPAAIDGAIGGSGGGGGGGVLVFHERGGADLVPTRPLSVLPSTVQWINTAEAANILGLSVMGARKLVLRGITHKRDEESSIGAYLLDRGHVERLAKLCRKGEEFYTAARIAETAPSPDLTMAEVADEVEAGRSRQAKAAIAEWATNPQPGPTPAEVMNRLQNIEVRIEQGTEDPVKLSEAIRQRLKKYAPSGPDQRGDIDMAIDRAAELARADEGHAVRTFIALHLSWQARQALERLVATGYFGDSAEACAESFVLAGIRANLSFVGDADRGDDHGR